MMTNDLRKAIKSKLNAIVTPIVYYRIADKDSMFPHIVFSLESSSMMDTDNNRYDYTLIIDIFDKNKQNNVEEITDTIIKNLNNLNLPKTTILPTIYLDSRRSLIDEDKDINHNQITFVVQMYERN